MQTDSQQNTKAKESIECTDPNESTANQAARSAEPNSEFAGKVQISEAFVNKQRSE